MDISWIKKEVASIGHRHKVVIASFPVWIYVCLCMCLETVGCNTSLNFFQSHCGCVFKLVWHPAVSKHTHRCVVLVAGPPPAYDSCTTYFDLYVICMMSSSHMYDVIKAYVWCQLVMSFVWCHQGYLWCHQVMCMMSYVWCHWVICMMSLSHVYDVIESCVWCHQVICVMLSRHKYDVIKSYVQRHQVVIYLFVFSCCVLFILFHVTHFLAPFTRNEPPKLLGVLLDN